MAEDRFEVIHREGGALADAGIRMVLRDRETGVCYLWLWSGNGGGLTPLLDTDGRPLVKKGRGSCTQQSESRRSLRTIMHQ